MFCTHVAWVCLVCLLLYKEEGSSPVSLQLLRGGIWVYMRCPCLCICWIFWMGTMLTNFYMCGIMLVLKAGSKTTQHTSGGAVTAVTNCRANCVETSHFHPWGPDLPSSQSFMTIGCDQVHIFSDTFFLVRDSNARPPLTALDLVCHCTELYLDFSV